MEDKLAFVEKSLQREKNQQKKKRSENTNLSYIINNKSSVMGSAVQFNHKLYDSYHKICNYKELIIKSENVQLNYNEATLEWKSYLIIDKQ